MKQNTNNEIFINRGIKPNEFIKSVEYNKSGNIMKIWFSTDTISTIWNVEPMKFKELKNSDSISDYWLNNIKDKYDYNNEFHIKRV